ncbi:LuxR C-terminal-related transcriptional regulator [Nonomuraea sp. NPDC051191]|uniref:helix-turn-helix transcriptional regulator n=1 Tax=Nonomuraea sp. NPDC051191 TaxID=3364372 RepID=UPI0037A38021
MYQIFGLDDDAEALYRLLLREGPLRADSFALNPAEGAIIERLRDDGLIYGEDVLTAARPGLALKGRLLERQRAINAAEALMSEYEALYQSNSRHYSDGVPVEVLTDPAHIRRTFSHIEGSARSELLSFVTAPFQVVTGDRHVVDPSDHPRCRILVEEEAFTDEAAVAAAQHSADSGCEVRVIDRLPFKLIIGDRRQALVPQAPGETMPVLLVHAGTVLDALVATFDVFWERALPRRTAWRNNGTDDTRPTQQEITILRHLARGATEQQIATTLTISKRTVIRRIQQLMDRAGVDTRFQLALHAARAGWLSKVVDA